MSPELYTLLGVLLGSIISQIGSIISLFKSRNDEKKEIFESKFSKAEEMIHSFLKEINKLDISLFTIFTSGYNPSFISEYTKKTYDLLPSFYELISILKTLRITDDENLIDEVDRFNNCFFKYFETTTNHIASDNTFDKQKLTEASVALTKNLTAIQYRIDKFKLNRYTPNRKSSKLTS